VNLNSTLVASQKNKSMRTFYEPIEQYFGHCSSENADAGVALRCVDLVSYLNNLELMQII
jgi:hypothetical protein